MQNSTLAWIGAACGVVLALIVISTVWCICKKKKKRSKKEIRRISVGWPHYDMSVRWQTLKQQTDFYHDATPHQSENVSDESDGQEDRVLWQPIVNKSHTKPVLPQPSQYVNKREIDWGSRELLRTESEDHTEASDEDVKGNGQRKVTLSRLQSQVLSLPPRVHLHILYTEMKRTLTVNVEKVMGLPFKYRNYTSHIRVNLYGKRRMSLDGQVEVKSRNPEYGENFVFSDLSFHEVSFYLLEVCVFVKKIKNKLIAETEIPLKDLNLQPNQPFTSYRDLVLHSRKKTPQTPEDYQEQGTLKLGLQYRLISQQIILSIKSAEDLGRKLSFRRHYICITLYKENQMIRTMQTTEARGSAPQWNETIQLEVPHKDLLQYWIKLDIIRSSTYRDTVAGHVFLGETAGGRGKQHWDEMLKLRANEEIQTHTIKM